MKKIVAWRPSAKIIAMIFTLALILMLIPLLRLSLYTAPWYDDYTYGLAAKRAVESGEGLRGALAGAWDCTRTSWYAWQGTYASIFFMSLMPGIWGEEFYFLGSVLLILLPVAGIFALTGVLAGDVLQLDRVYVLALQSVTTATVLMLIYSAKLAFYWYNGGIHYVGMHSFCLLMLAAAVKLLKAKNRTAMGFLVLGTMLGALISAGANFVTALQGLLALLTVAGAAVLCRNRRIFLLLPCLIVYGAGFFINVTAPGNDKRKANFIGYGYGPAESVLRSFQEAFLHLGEFTGWITVAVLVMLVPLVWQAVKKSRFAFRMPGLVLAASVCLYASGFTPSLYALGHAGLSRTLNAVKITYDLLLIINEVYWLGYLCRRLEEKGKNVPTGLCFWWFYPLVGAVMLFLFGTASDQAGSYSAYGAYYYIHTGEAYNFHREYLLRVEKLKGPDRNVEVDPYFYAPWFLCIGELSDDPNYEANRAIADWYGKESVVCKRREQNAE